MAAKSAAPSSPAWSAPMRRTSERWETLWHYMQGGPGVFKGDLYFYKLDGDIRGRVAQIDTRRCPLFLLSGEYDYSCTPEETLAVAKSIPGCEVTIMKGLGHFPMSEDPQAFLTHLLPVLEKIGAEVIRLARRRALFPEPRRQLAFPERGVDLGHGGAAIGLALAVEPLLMGAEIGDPRPDLGLEFLPQVGTGGGTGVGIARGVSTALLMAALELCWRSAAGGVSAQREASIVREGLWPDGWFRMSRRRAGRPTREPSSRPPASCRSPIEQTPSFARSGDRVPSSIS